MSTHESYVVIGGEGFLGHALVTALEVDQPTASIISLDLVQRHFPTPSRPLKHSFSPLDLTDVDSLTSALRKAEATTVFHTASPLPDTPAAICEKVNVKGTEGVIEACRSAGVKKLVYTSSASVVYSGVDLIGVDERMPYPEVDFDAYSATKARAERAVLEANGKDGLLTCALRPAGIFGPGDRQAIPGIISVLKNGQHGVQIGSNSNIFDWTYIDNIVHAHLLAASRLDGAPIPAAAFGYRLPAVSQTLPRRKLPNSINRSVEDDAWLDIEDTDKSPTSTLLNGEEVDPPLLARRSRFDQFSPFVFGDVSKGQPDSVSIAGEAFTITGGEPMFFWDFIRAVWHAYDPEKAIPRSQWTIPKPLGLVLGTLAEKWSTLMGRKPGFTRSKVLYSCTTRWFNIEKARVVLGYEPVVGVEEGIKRAVAWYKAEEAEKARSLSA